jgi:hypothetical protein
MLRLHFLQHWFNLSDPAAERGERVPGETTILNFRHLLERHDLTQALFGRMNAYVIARIAGKGWVDRRCDDHRRTEFGPEPDREARSGDAPDPERSTVVFRHEAAYRCGQQDQVDSLHDHDRSQRARRGCAGRIAARQESRFTGQADRGQRATIRKHAPSARDFTNVVLDAVLELRVPFDPDNAVSECAAQWCRNGTSKVAGDRYAGEWPVARFCEHGIPFEQPGRQKSHLYHGGARASYQLTGRGFDRSCTWWHEDVANAPPAVFFRARSRSQASAAEAIDLRTEGQPAPMPIVSHAIFAVQTVDDHGAAAIVYAELPPLPRH